MTTRPKTSRRSRPPAVLGKYRATIGVAAGWGVVLFLRAAGVGRSIGTTVLLFGICAATAYVVTAIAGAIRGEPPITAARKAIVLGLLAAVPVAFDNRVVDWFGSPKLALLSVGALALALLWVVDTAAYGRRSGPRSLMRWAALAFYAWTLVATIVSTNPRISVFGFFTDVDTSLVSMLSLGVLFLSAAGTIRPRDAKALLSVFYFGAGGLVVLDGLIPIAYQWAGRVYVAGAGGAPVRAAHAWVPSTLGNPNHVGGFVAMTFVTGLALAALSRNRWEHVAIEALTGSGLIELLYTAARGALVARWPPRSPSAPS